MRVFFKFITVNFFILNFASCFGEEVVFKDKNLSLVSPVGWRIERFGIGPVILRIETDDSNTYGSCNLTMLSAKNIKENQEFIDKNINSIPVSETEMKELERNFKSDGMVISYISPSILEVGGIKTKTVFYGSKIYSDLTKKYLYTDSFYSFYRRKDDYIGITCLGGWTDKIGSKRSFEKYIKDFENILSSIKFKLK